MAPKKEFTLQFTDSILFTSEPVSPAVSSCSVLSPGRELVEGIFNDPDAWSDGSSLGSDGSEELFPQNVGRGGRQSEFIVKPFTSKHRLMPQRASPPTSKPALEPSTLTWQSVTDQNGDRLSPIVTVLEPSGKDLKLDLQRMSIFFSHGNIFRAFPSPASPATPPSLGLTPLTVTTSVPSASSPICVSASATWSFLEWYGATPETPGLPRPASGRVLQPAPHPDWLKVPHIPHVQPETDSSSLLVPNVPPPTPIKYIPRRNRPLPTVPTPPIVNSPPVTGALPSSSLSSALPSSIPSSTLSSALPSSLASSSLSPPPPRAPRGARARARSPSPSPSLTNLLMSPPPQPYIPPPSIETRAKRALPAPIIAI